ncbi:MAG: S41 family peptidase [Candidatus Acidiferrales bacterium]
MYSKSRGLFLVLTVLALSAVLGGLYGTSAGATADQASDIDSSIRAFTRVLAVVEKNYAEPVNVDEAIYDGAIPGMLRLLDPHSAFLDARQFTVMREDQRGKYYGVGMTVAPREGRTIVQAPFPGSPAHKAGIRPGDVIVRVDGKPTDGLNTSEVADLLKGPKGTVVVVEVAREGYDEVISFTITRDEIPRHAVDQALLIQPGIGYIRLVGFNETTDRELQAALQKLNAATLEGLILDLRINPGGLLNEGIAVADMLLEKDQLIVSHRGRSSQERRYYATRGNRGVDVPLVILMSPQSASASEIVAGAVQDHDRGLIVGDNSFGKGLVQTVYNMRENTGLALTTARYYTPSGRLIQREYKDVSLYEYHTKRGKNSDAPAQVKLTDSGRQVYGGGGINPDMAVSPPKLTKFQQTLLRRDVFVPYEQGVGGFTRSYLGSRPSVTREFAAGDVVLNDFRRYLDSKTIEFSETDIAENLRWIQQKIRREVLLSVYGLDEGFKVSLEDDIQVQKAIEVLPEARALYENAKRVIAQRRNGGDHRR